MRTAKTRGITDVEGFKNALRSRSLKATAQRLAIHEAMMALGHASADMVREHIEENSGTNVTTASVYNILTKLADKGIYSRRLSSNNKMYFDIDAEPHAHLYDSVGNEFHNLQEEGLMKMVEDHFRKRRFKGYSIDNIDIQIVCHPTRKRRIK